MHHSFFFKKKGPFTLKEILDYCEIKSSNDDNLKKKFFDISTIENLKENSITFLNSFKYKNLFINSKATACITTSSLQKFLPNTYTKIIVKNVLFTVAKISKLFYPEADLDQIDRSLQISEKLPNKYPDVKFGKNVLIGKNVKIGANSCIGSNTIIEHDVIIGKNCIIGSDVVIKNTITEDSIYISDGAKLGQKGFGFIPDKNKNFRFPHIGIVYLKKGVEIGTSCTIDRGSISNTMIGENTFLDNQVHIAHNVKIGKNCMIAGQVGIAGSAILGDNVGIGGQAGISGHLKIGNNVQIGGGSGVIKDIPDNSKVMGYPSTSFKNFIKKIEA
jgi:UDP-3-O-[3-hydroxymyristoyl] glucosamine N-acyltransferase